MKKLISLLLALTMVAAMAAGCNNGASGKTPIADNMETVANTIIQKCPVEFMGGLMPVDLADTTEDGLWAISNNTGLQNAEKLSDIAVYESMMGVHGFSLVLVRVKDAADTKTVAQEMSDNINMRKWVCVGADEKIVVGYCDVVMLIMVDTGLGLTAQSYVDAFKTVCGDELDFTI